MQTEWKKLDLQLALLQVLLGARRIRPASGGAGVSELVDCLNAPLDLLEPLLLDLQAGGLIETAEIGFMITARGVDYVEEHSPNCTPPEYLVEHKQAPEVSKQAQPPWSQGDGPGPFPPRHDPFDPSRVPKNGKPSAGGSEIALPLPPPQDLAG